MRKILLFACLFVSFLAFSQKDVTGIVKDAETGEPLPGVSVAVKGTSMGAVTGVDGKFAFKLPNDAKVLAFSFIGYTSQEVAVGEKTDFSVSLQSDTKNIEEVVVTAMGISKQKKALGYSVQDIKSEAISKTGETNVINTLSSKVAGIQVISSSGTPGASSKILIRGNSSFTGNNQPLIVVDGIPMDNSTESTVAGDYAYNQNLQGVNYSNRALDINPDDVESVSVLKGPSASALYGARAANGAIVYTTKRGTNTGAPKITFGTTVDFDVVSQLPEEQSIYAQGTGGAYQPGGTPQSWGPKISSIDGAKSYNNTKDFFRTGVGITNNLSINGGNDKNVFRLSFSRLDQEGIVPNSDFKRNTVRLNADSKVTESFSVSGSASYTNSGGTKVQNGSNVAGVMLSLLRAPASWNLADWKNADGSNNSYYSYYDNPYWSVYNNPFKDDVDRFNGNIVLKYDILKWLNASYKLGLDAYSDKRKQVFAIGSNAVDNLLGQIEENTIRYQQYYQDVLFSANYNFIPKLSTGINFGGNMFQETSQSLYGRGRNLSVANFYNLSNAKDKYSDESTTIKRNSALFFDATIGWDNYLFLNVTGRNEWSSTFGSNNNNFFYPSVSLSYIFTEFIPKNEILSYGKLRIARAEAGNSPDAYSSRTRYVSPYFADGLTDGNSFPFLGTGGYTYNNVLGNPDLKPETSVETEIGTDLKFFNNKLGIEFTYYNKKTTDILVQRPVAGSSGFQSIIQNSGEMQNSGIEVVLNATPIDFRGFVWNIEANFSKNKNEVLALADGVDEISIESGFTEIGSYAIVGQPYGALYATRWERNDKGQLIIGANGLPKVSSTRGNIGNPFPDWTSGIRNTISFKGITISALLDIREGGKIWNGTIARLNRFGKTAASADRERTYVIPGVLADGTPNTIAVSANKYFSSYLGDASGTSAAENAVFDGSWVRLRELSISYKYNVKSSNKFINWLRFAEVSFIGRNLWVSTDYPGVDPETSLTGAGSNLSGFDYFNNPGTKTYSVGIKLGIF